MESINTVELCDADLYPSDDILKKVLGESQIVQNQVRNLVVEKGHWKLQNVVVETNKKGTTNDQDQRQHVL